MAQGYKGFNRNKGDAGGIKPGTVIVSNGAIQEAKLISGSISTSATCNGNTYGFNTTVSFTISDKLVGRALSFTLRGDVSYRCFNGQYTWTGTLKNGSTTVTSVNLINIGVGKSTSTTVTFTPTSTSFTITNYLNRHKNDTQNTQVDGSTIKLYQLTVL